MRRRTVIFGLAALFAVALAVPALGGPSNPVADVTANAKKTAKKALKKAKKANKAAKAAQSSADGAQGTADSAASAAATAQAAADAAQSTANTKFDDTTSNAGSTVGPGAANPKVAIASCPSGQDLTGGGFTTGGTGAGVTVIIDNAYGAGWTVVADDPGAAASWSLTATAVCARSTS